MLRQWFIHYLPKPEKPWYNYSFIILFLDSVECGHAPVKELVLAVTKPLWSRLFLVPDRFFSWSKCQTISTHLLHFLLQTELPLLSFHFSKVPQIIGDVCLFIFFLCMSNIKHSCCIGNFISLQRWKDLSAFHLAITVYLCVNWALFHLFNDLL